MDIGVLGTGSVGRTLAAGLAAAGHTVRLGTRDPQATLARTEPDRFGTPPVAQWCAEHPEVPLVAFAEVAVGADLVINATAGDASLEALAAAGADTLTDTVVLDVSNPLDFSAGFPPSLFVNNTDSLGEQIQRAFPRAKVVKSLNTMNAALMLAPGRLSAPSVVFLSGDDSAAKTVVRDLLATFGWEQIIDLGGIATSRGVEMLLPLWLEVMGVTGGPDFNWAIVR